MGWRKKERERGGAEERGYKGRERDSSPFPQAKSLAPQVVHAAKMLFNNPDNEVLRCHGNIVTYAPNRLLRNIMVRLKLIIKTKYRSCRSW